MKKQAKKTKIQRYGYKVVVHLDSLRERRIFEGMLDEALHNAPVLGKMNYLSGMSEEEVSDFVDEWNDVEK